MLVFIDGENFRQNLITILGKAGIYTKSDDLRYDLVGLLKDVLGTEELDVRYYSSVARPPVGYEPSKIIRRQLDRIQERKRKWATQLIRQGIKCVRAGSLKVKEAKPCPNCFYSGERLQEKGVDVRLAIDIFENALDESIEEIAVVSSDMDLCPVYHKAQEHSTRIKYVCFETSVNKAVSSATNDTIIIPIAKVIEFSKNPIAFVG